VIKQVRENPSVSAVSADASSAGEGFATRANSVASSGDEGEHGHAAHELFSARSVERPQPPSGGHPLFHAGLGGKSLRRPPSSIVTVAPRIGARSVVGCDGGGLKWSW